MRQVVEMKTLFFCLFLIIGSPILNAQILHEHSYDGKDFAHRVDFPTYGEKYAVIDENNLQIGIHNEDHSLWKTINLPVPAGATDLVLYWIREEVVNPDSLLEMAFRYRFNNEFHSRVIDETGVLLLDLPNTYQVYLNEVNGLQDKVIAWSSVGTSIYELPFLGLEHTYTNHNSLERVNLAYAGESYYALDRDSSDVYIYRSDHSLWKIIDLPTPGTSEATAIRSLSQNKIEVDSLLEIVYVYRDNNPTNYGEQLINETGMVLLTFPLASYAYISEEDGLPNKFIGVTSNGSEIYGIPGLSLEHSYPNKTIHRINLGLSGEKYYYRENDLITINNNNHTFWKGIPLLSSLDLDHISEDKIFSDSLLEIGYSYSSPYNPGHPSTHYAKIMNENGLNLLTVADAYSTRINTLDSLSTKIIAYMALPNCCYSDIYGILDYNNIINLENPVKTIKTYPNPASTWVTIENPNVVIKNIRLLDVRGRMLRPIESKEDKIALNVSDLTTGIYFIKGEDEKGNEYLSKLIID